MPTAHSALRAPTGPLRFACVGLVCAALVLSAGRARAALPQEVAFEQAPTQERVAVPAPVAVTGRALSDMTRAELEGEGFSFADHADAQRRAQATLLAASGGLFLHGLGHYYLGERPTAVALLSMEAIALALLLGSSALDEMPREASLGLGPAPSLGQSMQPVLRFVGLGLFVGSWILDVLGTMYSDELGFFDPPVRERDWALGARYSYLSGQEGVVGHALMAESQLVFERYFATARMTQDVLLQMSAYGLSAGYRWPWSRRPASHGFAGAQAEWWHWADAARPDFALGAATLGLSYDLGDLYERLDQLVLEASASLAVTSAPSLAAQQLDWQAQLPLRMSVHGWLTSRVRLAIAYERQATSLVDAGRTLAGIPSVELRYRSTEQLDAIVRLDAGQATSVTGGFVYHLWE